MSLAGQLAAAIALENSFPDVSGTVVNRLPRDVQLVSLGYDDVDPSISLYVNPGAAGFDCKLSLPACLVPKSNSRLKAPRLYVRLFMSRDERPNAEGHQPIVGRCMMEEVTQLATMNAMVLQTIWEKLSFETWESAAQTTAEAILRTLHQPLIAGLLVEKVEVLVANQYSTAQTPTYSAQVSRRDRGDELPSQQARDGTGSKTSGELQKDAASVSGVPSDVKQAGTDLTLSETFE